MKNIDQIQKIVREIESLSEVLALSLEGLSEYSNNNPLEVAAWVIRDKAEELSNLVRDSM